MRRWKRWVDRCSDALLQGDHDVRAAATRRLAELRLRGPGSLRPRQVAALIARLQAAVVRHPDPDTRRDVAYLLAQWGDRRTVGVFLGLLTDVAAEPEIRGLAAEALGFDLQFVPRASALRSRTVAALRGCLTDAAPAVRFWSLYALGTLDAREARADVAKLGDDEAIFREGFWSVGDEAREVLALFDAPER